uniref:Uncharacterized protein n=1 Tax=Arundo donax TaxID=35708 RepID=A0A0A8Z2A7_ARUDO
MDNITHQVLKKNMLTSLAFFHINIQKSTTQKAKMSLCLVTRESKKYDRQTRLTALYTTTTTPFSPKQVGVG